jgi:hypothetical protein
MSRASSTGCSEPTLRHRPLPGPRTSRSSGSSPRSLGSPDAPSGWSPARRAGRSWSWSRASRRMRSLPGGRACGYDRPPSDEPRADGVAELRLAPRWAGASFIGEVAENKGDWLSRLERTVHIREVTGSNPVSPTIVTPTETGPSGPVSVFVGSDATPSRGGVQSASSRLASPPPTTATSRFVDVIATSTGGAANHRGFVTRRPGRGPRRCGRATRSRRRARRSAGCRSRRRRARRAAGPGGASR